MLDALAAGQRDPMLAQMAHSCVRGKVSMLAEALTGHQTRGLKA